MDPVKAQNVSFFYKDTSKKVLHDISFSISKGKFILLCGPTGSGKTSLIRTMNGLIPHFYHGKFYGYMKINGKDTIENTSPGKLSQYIGSVFQLPENQLFSMNVERELAFSLENLGFSREDISARINKAVKIMGIDHLRSRPPYKLSGGEQQKVAIAALLALDPEILVLDEPLSNMDPHSAAEMVQLLKSLQVKYQKTIIISEHRLEYVLDSVDEIMVISDGAIIDQGSLQDVLNGDSIFSSGVDLPPLFHRMKKILNESSQKDLDNKNHPFPISFQDQVDFVGANLQNLEVDGNPKEVPTSEPQIKSALSPVIHLQNVFFSYQAEETKVNALKNISFSIFPGEIVGILGENGAGKSTLLKCLNGILRPQSGNIWVDGKDTSTMPIHKLSEKVGVMFQNPDHQLFATTIRDEINFSLKNLSLPPLERERRIENILKMLQLEDLIDESPFNVSGGQKKKISLAAILCRETPIIVFDEPTIGQDADQKKILATLIHNLQQKGHTIIIVTHDMGFIADLASRILLLHRGEILTDATVPEIFNDPHILALTQLQSPLFHRIIEKLIQKGKLTQNFDRYCVVSQVEEWN